MLHNGSFWKCCTQNDEANSIIYGSLLLLAECKQIQGHFQRDRLNFAGASMCHASNPSLLSLEPFQLMKSKWMRHLYFALTAQSGSEGIGEGLLTQCIEVPAKRSAMPPPPQECHWANQQSILVWDGKGKKNYVYWRIGMPQAYSNKRAFHRR